jgi:uncharacterized repeat protein (TIGR01451 family)
MRGGRGSERLAGMASRIVMAFAALSACAFLATATARADTAESTLRPANFGLIATSADHTCAILTDGGVRCWGNGGFGELGYDSKTSIGGGAANGYALMSSLSPVALGGHKAVQVTATGPSTCALLDDGSVRCWGAGGFGQLGYDSAKNLGDGVAGDTTMANLGPVNLGQRAVAISGGDYHTCAILADGSVKCWGLGASGELGQASYANAGDNSGPSFLMANLPAVNLGGHKAVAITAGGPSNLDTGDTCVILDDGSVRCWGDDSFGQLGHDRTGNIEGGTGSGSIAAVGAVPLPQKAVAISTGGYHTCVILADGTVRCWGDGADGQLGNDSTKNAGDGVAGDTTMGNLTAVPLGQPATAISAGIAHSCAVLLDGSVKCWGYNGFGQLGYDSTKNAGTGAPAMSALPAVNLRGQTAVAISTGEGHNCVLVEDGTLRCWGLGGFGGLGYDSPLNVGDGVMGAHPHTAMAALGPVPLALPLATTSADLSLTLQPSAAGATIGDALTLTATLSNAGPDAATGSQVSMTLPAGLTLGSADASQGTATGSGPVAWTPGALASGATATLTLHVTAAAAGTFDSRAELTAAGQPDPDSVPGDGPQTPAEDDTAGAAVTVTAAGGGGGGGGGDPSGPPDPTPVVVPSGPVPVSPAPPAITPAPAVSAAQVAAGLLAQLKPTAAQTSIGSLLKTGKITVTLKTLAPGTARISWYWQQPKHKAVLVALGQAVASAPGKVKLVLKLTAAGRKALKAHRRLVVTADGRFAVKGGGVITVHRAITLKYKA